MKELIDIDLYSATIEPERPILAINSLNAAVRELQSNYQLLYDIHYKGVDTKKAIAAAEKIGEKSYTLAELRELAKLYTNNHYPGPSYWAGEWFLNWLESQERETRIQKPPFSLN